MTKAPRTAPPPEREDLLTHSLCAATSKAPGCYSVTRSIAACRYAVAFADLSDPGPNAVATNLPFVALADPAVSLLPGSIRTLRATSPTGPEDTLQPTNAPLLDGVDHLKAAGLDIPSAVANCSAVPNSELQNVSVASCDAAAAFNDTVEDPEQAPIDSTTTAAAAAIPRKPMAGRYQRR